MIHTWNFTDWMARPRRPAEFDVEQGGGVTYRQGAHQIDILRLIGGGLVKSVRATTFDWDESRRSIGAHTILLQFRRRRGRDRGLQRLRPFLRRGADRRRRRVGHSPSRAAQRASPGAALSPEQELAAKRKRARTAIPVERAAPAAFRLDAGELRARRHPPVAGRPAGLFGEGREEIALPNDKSPRDLVLAEFAARHRRQAHHPHRPLGSRQSRSLHGGDRSPRAPEKRSS